MSEKVSSTLSRGVVVLMIAGLLTACAADSQPDQSGQETAPKTLPSAEAMAQPETSSQSTLVRFEDRRHFDLTGDGMPEVVQVMAEGPSYDSLDVVLEIRAASGALLYEDRWSSMYYFQYDPREGKPDSTVERIVLGHLQEILRDEAFERKDADLDDEALEFGLARLKWQRSHALPDTAVLSLEAYEEISRTQIPEEELSALRTELMGKPSFTYFSGGEAIQKIAWSENLGRFVLTFSCC